MMMILLDIAITRQRQPGSAAARSIQKKMYAENNLISKKHGDSEWRQLCRHCNPEYGQHGRVVNFENRSIVNKSLIDYTSKNFLINCCLKISKSLNCYGIVSQKFRLSLKKSLTSSVYSAYAYRSNYEGLKPCDTVGDIGNFTLRGKPAAGEMCWLTACVLSVTHWRFAHSQRGEMQEQHTL